MRPGLRYTLVAALLCLVGALLVHAYDCQVGTYEACLISQGFLWIYWLVLFVVVGIPGAWIVADIRGASDETPRDPP